ncbi:hypothetical protein AB8850_10405, partial [Streptomyces griseorubens]
QPEKDGSLTANTDATAAGVLGALGKGLLVEPGKGDGAGSCVKATTPEQAAANGAAHLAGALAAKGYLLASTPGAEDQPDFGNTADAVVALAAQGDTAQARKSYAWLEKNAGDWAAQSGPGAYAQLILASHATGADPRDFGGTDLVKQLQAAGPAAPGKTTEAAEKAEDEKDSDSPFGVWWFVGVCLVAGIGIGFLISNRTKRQQP